VLVKPKLNHSILKIKGLSLELKKVRPVGFDPTSPGLPGVLLHSTTVSVTEGGFDPPTFEL